MIPPIRPKHQDVQTTQSPPSRANKTKSHPKHLPINKIASPKASQTEKCHLQHRRQSHLPNLPLPRPSRPSMPITKLQEIPLPPGFNPNPQRPLQTTILFPQTRHPTQQSILPLRHPASETMRPTTK